MWLVSLALLGLWAAVADASAPVCYSTQQCTVVSGFGSSSYYGGCRNGNCICSSKSLCQALTLPLLRTHSIVNLSEH